MIVSLSTLKMSKWRGQRLEFAQWCLKLGEHYNQLWSNLESTPVCLLIDGIQEFMFLTSASSGLNVVFIKPIFGNLYQTTQLVVTRDYVIHIYCFSSLQ